MNYELALELKNAGFPQPTYRETMANFKSGYWIADPDDKALPELVKHVYCPTLSELIETCGNEFYNLEHVQDGGIDGNEELWWAYGKNHSMGGESPQEAMARLWIKLNEHDTN